MGSAVGILGAVVDFLSSRPFVTCERSFVSFFCFSSSFLSVFVAFPFSISSTHLSKFSVEGVKGRLQELRKVRILMAARTNP